MTKNEFIFTLTIAVGEAFARHVSTQAKTPEGKRPAYVRPVKMKDYFVDEDDMPSCLDYIPEEDFITARCYDGKYVITFYGSNDFDFTVRSEDYWTCILDFVEDFMKIFKA